MDLGSGGMRLKYFPDISTCTQWISTDIFTGEPNRVLIRDLGGKMVYDIADLMENGSFSGSDVRICGVRFERLTDAQKDDLEKLFQHATITWRWSPANDNIFES